MNIKQVKAMNIALSEFTTGINEMRQAIASNTKEVKKMNNEIDKVKAEDAPKRTEFKNPSEFERYPLAEGTPPAIEVDGRALLLKKLNIL